IGFARTPFLRMIDVLESVLLSQLRQRIGLKPEPETQIEQRSVLAQRHRRAAHRNQPDRSLQQMLSLAARRRSCERLAPIRDVDAARHLSDETRMSPDLA